MTKKSFMFFSAFLVFNFVSNPALADDTGKWYGKIYGGSSILGDQTIKQTGVAAAGATGKNENDSGMTLGGALGYNYTNNTSVELAWDYTSNDTSNKFSDGTNFNEGNFASSIFFLNGRYTFDPIMQTKLRPYSGAGIGYVEEIDIDLETGGVENSYSKSGEFAYQVMTGVTYPLSEKFDLDAGVRYMRIDGINLKREGGTGELRNVDYDPLLLNVGVSYKF